MEDPTGVPAVTGWRAAGSKDTDAPPHRDGVLSDATGVTHALTPPPTLKSHSLGSSETRPLIGRVSGQVWGQVRGRWAWGHWRGPPTCIFRNLVA